MARWNAPSSSVQGIGAKINRKSIFARKNYFTGRPKGYQISQSELPIVEGGTLTIQGRRLRKTINLTRAHLEEDAGKSLHEDFHGSTGIDLNRAGTPLLKSSRAGNALAGRPWPYAKPWLVTGSASATAICRRQPA